MAGQKNKSKSHPSRQKPPPIDKLLLPAVGIGLALLAYQFFRGLNSEISRVNVLDELELREIFFAEGADSAPTDKNYVLLCHNEDSKIPISSVFQDAHNDGSVKAEFRLIDCNYVLPSSEKSIAERFKLDLKQRPTVFVSGAVGDPKQIPVKHLKTGAMLVKALRGLFERRATKIETTADLRGKCLEKDICALLLKGSKQAPKYLKDAIGKLLKEFPSIEFASIDSSVLYVKNLEEHLDELDESTQQPRFVVFKKVSGSTDKSSSSRLITSIVPLEGSVSYGTMSNLLADVVSRKKETTKISTLPMVKTRTKKLVQEEKAKRQRKEDQQRRKEDGDDSSTTTPGGYFQANDGSREGRKAERERRRAEHLKANNVREKTPEEKAELERQRRQRMEEEAAKWNMAPEDLPEEGEIIDDDSDLGDFMEEGETVVYEDVEEDDEDVMDLD